MEAKDEFNRVKPDLKAAADAAKAALVDAKAALKAAKESGDQDQIDAAKQ